jgi:hypothetical protein
MKRYFAWMGLGLLGLFASAMAFAVDAPPEGGAVVGAVASFLTPLLEAAAGKYGWVVAVFVVIATLRMINKPLFAIVEAVVSATPGKSDDKFVEDMKNHAVYKWISWVLDYLGSIKLPQSKKE